MSSFRGFFQFNTHTSSVSLKIKNEGPEDINIFMILQKLLLPFPGSGVEKRPNGEGGKQNEQATENKKDFFSSYRILSVQPIFSWHRGGGTYE